MYYLYIKRFTQLLNIVEVAEPGSQLSVARVILESEYGVISESECSDIILSPVDSNPLILELRNTRLYSVDSKYIAASPF